MFWLWILAFDWWHANTTSFRVFNTCLVFIAICIQGNINIFTLENCQCLFNVFTTRNRHGDLYYGNVLLSWTYNLLHLFYVSFIQYFEIYLLFGCGQISSHQILLIWTDFSTLWLAHLLMWTDLSTSLIGSYLDMDWSIHIYDWLICGCGLISPHLWLSHLLDVNWSLHISDCLNHSSLFWISTIW